MTEATLTLAEHRLRVQLAIACCGLLAMVNLLVAKMGALRAIDAVVVGGVSAVAIVMAYRNSRHLPLVVLAAWLFTPFVRRVIDWKMGGFESVTSLSLLPFLVTFFLIIPTLPRIGRVPASVRYAIGFLVVPVFAAGLLGATQRGAAAVIDTAAWTACLVLIPYFMTQGFSESDRLRIFRWFVVLASVSAAYGIVQFFVLPDWDRIWLIESGMTSSMGRPYPRQIRIWGTINACAPAALVWSSAAVVALFPIGLSGHLRAFTMAVLLLALLLSRVRSCWISFAVGVALYLVYSRQVNARVVALSLVAILGSAIALPWVPGSEIVLKRIETFENIEEDNSFQERLVILETLTRQIAKKPLGTGLGFRSAGKLSGESKLTVVDNGVAEVFYALGIPGGTFWAIGMLFLWMHLRAAGRAFMGQSVASFSIASILLLMSLLTLASSYSLAGVGGLATWLAYGLCLQQAYAPVWVGG